MGVFFSLSCFFFPIAVTEAHQHRFLGSAQQGPVTLKKKGKNEKEENGKKKKRMERKSIGQIEYNYQLISIHSMALFLVMNESKSKTPMSTRV